MPSNSAAASNSDSAHPIPPSQSPLSVVNELLTKRGTACLLDLETLAIALKHHREPSQDVLKFLKDNRQLGRDSLYRRLAKFDLVFRRQASEKLYRQLEFLLNVYHNIVTENGTLRLRIGASRALARVVLPEIIKPFRDWCSEQKAHNQIDFDVIVDIETGLSKGLRDLGDQGELDLILTACPESYRIGVVAELTLLMQIVCPRDHELARGQLTTDRIRSLFRGMTIVQLKQHPDRQPHPHYPVHLTAAARTIEEVDTYEDMYNIIKSASDVVGFGYAELLDTDEQRFLETVNIPEFRSTVRVCLIRPTAAKLWRSEVQSDVINELQQRFSRYLDGISQPLFSDEDLARLPGRFCAYHVRLTGREQWGWAEGRLRLRFTKNGYVKGEHLVEPIGLDGDSDPLRQLIFGQVSANPLRKDTYHMVWQGEADPLDPNPEVYVASFICQRGRLEAGYLAGTWLGRGTYDPKEYRHAAGFLVIRPEDRPVTEVDELNEAIADHEREFGTLSLNRPSVWANLGHRRPLSVFGAGPGCGQWTKL